MTRVLVLCAIAATGIRLSAFEAFGIIDPTLNVGIHGGNQGVVLRWPTFQGVIYQVEAGSLSAGWTNVSPVITGTGGTVSFTNAASAQPAGFLRVKRVFSAAPGSAVFNAAAGVLTIVCDSLHTNIVVANDGTGNITVNSGTIPIVGGPATVANTFLIQVLGSTADDQITIGSSLPPAHLFGGEGYDILTGGTGSDMLVGGPGSDTLTGGLGNDVVCPDGNDTVIWNPGNGSDVVQGTGTNNTFVLNGANVSEYLTLSANGSRLLLNRDIGAVTLDIGGVQTVRINTLGGSDSIAVNNLAGSCIAQVQIDLAAVVGTTNGDAAVDTILINGLPGADTFQVGANGAAVEVTGMGALVRVSGGEMTNDHVVISGVGGDRVNVNGTGGADTLQVFASPVTNYVRATASDFTVPVDVNGALTLALNGLGGADTITAFNGLAALGVPLILDGGDGDDTITGGDASETIFGGPGNDVVSGGLGNDLVFLGDGNDTFAWNPGNGSDTIEGEGGTNTLVFNASNVSESIDLSANGSRLRLTRNVGTIVLDVDGMQTVNVLALGGTDTVTVNSLAGTAVSQVNIDLAASVSGGDAAADTIVINGTAAAETFDVAASGTAVEIAGIGAVVQVLNAEPANDRIVVNGVGGDRVNVNGTDGADTMQVAPSSATNILRVSASGFTAPLDVSGALTLWLNGLGGSDVITALNGVSAAGIPLVLAGGDGDDTITGGDASETILGGPGNDTVRGGLGNDVVVLGEGNDTFTWNPGDGSDTIEGEGGANTLIFNASNISESVDLSANGSRLRLARNVGSIVLDVNGMQTVNVQALGGTDTLTVNSLAGTAVGQVNVDLAASGGGGDLVADVVTVNGTSAADTINISAFAGLVQVNGLVPQVQIAHPEAGSDSLVVNGLAGTDTINVGAGVTSLMNVTVNQ